MELFIDQLSYLNVAFNIATYETRASCRQQHLRYFCYETKIPAAANLGSLPFLVQLVPACAPDVCKRERGMGVRRSERVRQRVSVL